MQELDELRRQKNAADFSAKAQSAKSHLRSKLHALENDIDPVAKRRQDNYRLPRPLKAGDEVLLTDIDKKAVVLAPRMLPATWRYRPASYAPACGGQPAAGREKKNETKAPAARTRGTASRAVREVHTEIDLRGLTGEEAILEADRFIDDAVMSGLERVTPHSWQGDPARCALRCTSTCVPIRALKASGSAHTAKGKPV